MATLNMFVDLEKTIYRGQLGTGGKVNNGEVSTAPNTHAGACTDKGAF